MLKQGTTDSELVYDLTHLSDGELLKVLRSAKCAAQELEEAIDDNRHQTVIDAILQWEVVDALEHEKMARSQKRSR